MSSFQSRKLLNSEIGVRKTNVGVAGAINGVNTTYETPDEFIPGTLEVLLEGITLNSDQSDPTRDVNITKTGPKAYKEFTIITQPDNPNGLNSPPCQGESLKVNYQRRVRCD